VVLDRELGVGAVRDTIQMGRLETIINIVLGNTYTCRCERRKGSLVRSRGAVAVVGAGGFCFWHANFPGCKPAQKALLLWHPLRLAPAASPSLASTRTMLNASRDVQAVSLHQRPRVFAHAHDDSRHGDHRPAESLTLVPATMLPAARMPERTLVPAMEVPPTLQRTTAAPMAKGPAIDAGLLRPAHGPGSVGLCAMFTLRYEAPYLLPWLAWHLMAGVSHIWLYHDDASPSYSPRLTETHSELLRTLRRSQNVSLLSMRSLGLSTQDEQLAHCDFHAAGEFEWVGVWDLDEAPVAGDGGSELPSVPSLLATMPRHVLGVIVPRVTMGAFRRRSREDALPSATLLEYESLTVRANVHSHGKTLWRAGRQVHPMPIAGHTLMARNASDVAWPSGDRIEAEPVPLEACEYKLPNKSKRACGRYWRDVERALGRVDITADPLVVLPEDGAFWQQPTAHGARLRLPFSALPLRLHHYEVRSDVECARRANLTSNGADIFQTPLRYSQDRCDLKQQQFRDDQLDPQFSARTDETLAQHGPAIREGVKRYFGADADAVLSSEMRWYHEKLQGFMNGGEADF